MFEGKPRIMTKKDTYTFDYPQAEIFTAKQMKTIWFPDEVNVEKDLHCIMVELSDSERHGVLTTLRLFLGYELVVGNEYWSGVVAKYLPRPEIQKMANMFSFVEINIHAPFYDKINKALGIATDEFYSSYVDDPTLKARMDYLDEVIGQTKENLPLSLAVFSMVEGAILYSSFAFLKHFESNGKNKLTNIVAGINFSQLDEALHSEAGAWLHNQVVEELGLDAKALAKHQQDITDAAEYLREHEHKIVDMIFEKGDMGPNSVTKEQLKCFVNHRISVCLNNLGVKNKLGTDHDDSVEEWFYSGTGYILHDFFSKVGNGYVRDWDKSEFTWGL